MRFEKERGATLLELMIASALILIVLSVSLSLILSCVRYFRETDGAVQVHDTVLSAITKLERDLKESNPSSFQIYAAPQGVVFASPRLPDNTLDFDDTSLLPLWQKRVCYYLEPAGAEFNLVRKEEFLPPASVSDTPPPPTVDTAYFQANVSTGGVVARGVTRFDWVAGPPVQVTLACTDISHRGADSEAEFLVEVSTSVSFRN